MNKIIEEDLNTIVNSPMIPWESFRGKTVLISGANGMLPSYMVETLLFLNTRGFKIKVLGLVRNEAKAKTRFKKYLEDNMLTFIVQDISSPVITNQPIDYIIHAASQASPRYYSVDPVGTLSANTVGTYNLLRLATEKKVKTFLFFSSGEIYGETDKMPIKESDYGYLDPLEPRSCYAESKRMGETTCISFQNQYHVPVKIVRPFHTYGPGINLEDGRVFADFISNVVSSVNIAIKGDGMAKRTFCYLADATIAFFMVLLKGEAGEAYNVGSEEEVSIKELADKIVNLFPNKHLKVEYLKKDNGSKYIRSKVSRAYPDLQKIKSLGWSPKYSIEEGFERTILSCGELIND